MRNCSVRPQLLPAEDRLTKVLISGAFGDPLLFAVQDDNRAFNDEVSQVRFLFPLEDDVFRHVNLVFEPHAHIHDQVVRAEHFKQRINILSMAKVHNFLAQLDWEMLQQVLSLEIHRFSLNLELVGVVLINPVFPARVEFVFLHDALNLDHVVDEVVHWVVLLAIQHHI